MAGARRRKTKGRIRGRIAAGPPTLSPLWSLGLCLAGFAIALSVRLLYIASIREAPFFEHLQTNSLRYQQWATLLLDGPLAPPPPFDQPPGYAYLLALFYRGFGRSVAAVTTAQAVLDALTCAIIVHVAQVWFGWRAAIVAGVLAALCAPMIYFCAEMLPATVSLTVLVAAVAAMVHQRWLSAGLLWAVGILLRSEVLIAAAVAVVVAARRGGRAALLRTVLPVTLVLASFTIMNGLTSGHFVPLTIGSGLNLWLGNNPHADGVNPFVSGAVERVALEVRAQASGDPVVADRLFQQRAIGFWKSEPQQALGLLLKKLVWTWTQRELPNTSDIEWQTAQSWLFSRPLLVGFGLLLPPALAGLILARRRAHELAAALPLLALAVMTSTVFFTNARFRLPMIPVLIWMAAYWLGEILNRHRRGFEPISCLGLVGGTLLAWGNFYGVGAYWVPQIAVNTGIIERSAGRVAAAAEHLRRGVTANPSDAIGWVHLALALEQMGLVPDAVDAYLDGLTNVPDSTDLQSMARRSLIRNQVPTALLDAYLTTGVDKEAAAAALRNAVLAAHRPIP